MKKTILILVIYLVGCGAMGDQPKYLEVKTFHGVTKDCRSYYVSWDYQKGSHMASGNYDFESDTIWTRATVKKMVYDREEAWRIDGEPKLDFNKLNIWRYQDVSDDPYKYWDMTNSDGLPVWRWRTEGKEIN